MQTNLEQMIESVRTLPFEDLDRLREVIDEERNRKQIDEAKRTKLQQEIAEFKKSEKWLAENCEKYMNQWVCLEGDKLIAHGDDGRKVYQTAVAKGIKAPFIHYVEKEPEAYWGGWL